MMRRQVKPFVTEYRGSGRRNKDLPFRDMRDDEPRNKDLLGGPAPQADLGGSYEAALRAADALFAPHQRPAAPSSRAPDRDFTSETSPLSNEAQTSLSAKGGRILHAIEQVEPIAAAVSMPDRAPGRRGRKPGSKNKPKPSRSFDGLTAEPATARAAPVGFKAGVRASKSDAMPPAIAPGKPVARVAKRKRVERFAWVRTKLRPGEKWKRRLPKVMW